MKLFSIFSNRENCIEASRKLLSVLNVKVTITTLENDLVNHPDYPSLLSISDILTGYGVENMALKSSIDQLAGLPSPFMVTIIGEKTYNELFTVIAAINDDIIKYYDPEKSEWVETTRERFEKKWVSGIVLLANADNESGEKNYHANRRKEKRSSIAQYSTWLALPAIAALVGLWSLLKFGSVIILPVMFLVVSLSGCIISILLLWYELDEYHPLLQQICSPVKKANCGAILNSNASRIAGISWSALGFTYFAGCLLISLFGGLASVPVLFILAWLNALAVPYVFFSVYYQWRIVKQWCVLCLGVQGLLGFQLIIASTAGWHTALPFATIWADGLILPFLLAFVIPFIMVNLLMPAYRTNKESKRLKSELLRLKHNPQIFEALLAKQKTISESSEGLGITLGNANAVHKIIKVCNPFCGPCSKAHLPMEELLHNNADVQIQIIFNASATDVKTPPVKHLLAIAEMNDERITKQALDDWYLPDTKDYEAFAAKYPMNGELKQQDNKINAMHEWCNNVEINFTPTFFVNGHQLPEIYSVADLKYFLSV